MTGRLPTILAMTGASGAPYAVRLLGVLAQAKVPVWLIVSSHGMRLLSEECGIESIDALREATGGDWNSITHFPDGDRGGKPASGSQKTAGMVICPCSMGTVSAVAHGSSRSPIAPARALEPKGR